MSHNVVTKPSHGTPVVIVDGKPIQLERLYQNFFDDLQQKLNDHVLGQQLELEEYTVATLPAVPTAPGLIFVRDETGGAVPAFSDGSNWLRITDRAIVS